MKQFVAYYDYLGFKQLVESNSEERLAERANHILRDIGMALGQNKPIKVEGGIGRPDISESSINCLNISDTVIFWTIDDTVENAKELMEVAYRFNWQSNLFNLPVRGALIYDHFHMRTGKSRNAKGAIFSPNLMYGKGLIKAHTLAEQLDWAGTIIDNTFIERITSEINFYEFFDGFVTKYNVPYKGFYRNQYAMNLGKPIIDNPEALKNTIKSLRNNFEDDYKSVTPSVERKLENTIKYLEHYQKQKDDD